MDLPPSGWYPDPYGTPDLLRWWDGLNWTRHTHPGVDAADTGGGVSGGAGQGGVQATTVQATTVQPTAAQAQPTTVQPSAGQAGGGWAARDRVIGDWAGTDWPTGEQLATTKPPKGPRTEPQPALPETSVQSPVQATRYQPAVQPTTTQPAVQATTVQPPADIWGATSTQPNSVQPGADGTQVLFLGGDTWQAPGGPAQPNPFGYQEAQQRRRLWLIGGIAAGTVVAVAIIVVVATSMGGSSGATAADQSRVTTPPSPTAAASAPASPTASPTASATPPASVLSDGQSGLSYSQLATPWTAGCPTGLDTAFSWTAGESAVTGQVNGGQTTWYGEACSGPLPAQYNYSGPSDLENTATNVAQTLGNAYYTALDHTSAPVLSQPVSVSGHAGWEMEYQITYTNATAQGATWSSEEAAVVVVDTGTGNTPVVFFASVPNTLGTTTVNSLVSSLQLTVVPNPGGPPNDGGSPAPGGSPGD
ncbi:MAG TPA: DUF2510 domain-containing protein [Trebonia sp.]|nr:DUF2510 domain-containing protein [Trebonia sp.]